MIEEHLWNERVTTKQVASNQRRPTKENAISLKSVSLEKPKGLEGGEYTYAGQLM
jgi:hypothetical protein